jgi:hypothetical protein
VVCFFVTHKKLPQNAGGFEFFSDHDQAIVIQLRLFKA